MTDNTLVQLSIHCPRLQALVNAHTCSSVHMSMFLLSACGALIHSFLCGSSSLVTLPWPVPFPLRADHRWWHQSSEQQHLWPRAPHCGGAGQLPSHHRRYPGAPEELPSPGAHRALRLSASHQSWHQTHSGQWKILAQPLRVINQWKYWGYDTATGIKLFICRRSSSVWRLLKRSR